MVAIPTWSSQTPGQRFKTELENQDQVLIEPPIDFYMAAPCFAS